MIYCSLCQMEHKRYKTRKKLNKTEQVFMACTQYHDGDEVEVLPEEMDIANKLIKKGILKGSGTPLTVSIVEQPQIEVKKMNLYLISQMVNEGWDVYDAAVVVAENEAEARQTHPAGSFEADKDAETWVKRKDIDKIEVEYLGETKLTKGIVLKSFRAG